MPVKKTAAEECCAKCEKDVAALKKEVAALKKELNASKKQYADLALLVKNLQKGLSDLEAKPAPVVKDARVDKLVALNKKLVPNFGKNWNR